MKSSAVALARPLATLLLLLLLLQTARGQQQPAACADDPTGELQAAIQLDCAAAIAQTGGSCPPRPAPPIRRTLRWLQ